jgi:hypothetical protein
MTSGIPVEIMRAGWSGVGDQMLMLSEDALRLQAPRAMQRRQDRRKNAPLPPGREATCGLGGNGSDRKV